MTEKLRKNENKADIRRSRAAVRIGNTVTAAVFSAVLCAFLIVSLAAPDREFSENENRYLAKLPEPSAKDIADGSFGAAFELYAQDQLAGRDSLIMMKTAGDRILGKKDNGSVYFGKDGYLFAIEEINTIQLEKNTGYADEFCEKAEERGINVRIMVVPTATEILSDKLPKNAAVPNQSEAIEKIKAALGASFIDVTDILHARRGEYIYYRTDHHWTTLGAYYAYRQYDEEMRSAGDSGIAADGKSISDIEAPAKAGYTESIVSDSFLGTNDSKAPGVKTEPDTIVRLSRDGGVQSKKGTSESTENEDVYKIRMSILNARLECEKTFDSVYDESYLNKKDKYSYFLSGNNPITVIEHAGAEDAGSGKTAAGGANEYKPESKTLLVVKDSYAHSFIPFLTENYGRIVAVDMRYFRSSLDKIIDEYEVTDILVLYNILNFANDSNLVYLAR